MLVSEIGGLSAGPLVNRAGWWEGDRSLIAVGQLRRMTVTVKYGG